jgi:hypothetical protein
MPTTFWEYASYNLSVHRLYPAGGWLHAIAIIFASTSPVTFVGTGGVSRFFLDSTRSSPFSPYCLLTVYTNFFSHRHLSAISASVSIVFFVPSGL